MKEKKVINKKAKNAHLGDLDEGLLARQLLQIEPLDLRLGGLSPLADGGAEVALYLFLSFF